MSPEAAPDSFIFLHFTLPGSYSEVRSAALTGDLKANVGYFSHSSLFTTRTAIQWRHKPDEIGILSTQRRWDPVAEGDGGSCEWNAFYDVCLVGGRTLVRFKPLIKEHEAQEGHDYSIWF